MGGSETEQFLTHLAAVKNVTIRQMSIKTGIHKNFDPHTLRHSFATYLLEAGYDIRTMHELLGRKDVNTTMIYIHVLNSEPTPVRSPLDE